MYGIVTGQTSALDMASATIDRMNLLPPIDRLICMIIQCDRGGIFTRTVGNDTSLPETPLLPPLLDPASALEEIRGWAEGSIPIGDVVELNTFDYEIPSNIATDFAGALAGLVEVWQQKSEASTALPQKMAVRAVGEDALTKRNPALIYALVHLAYLLYTL